MYFPVNFAKFVRKNLFYRTHQLAASEIFATRVTQNIFFIIYVSKTTETLTL